MSEIKLPSLDYTVSPAAVKANKELLAAAWARNQAEQKALQGLEIANQALCAHPNKRDVYDPGYAGGGWDGYRCPDCGKRGVF